MVLFIVMNKHKWLVAPSVAVLLLAIGFGLAPSSSAQSASDFKTSECYTGDTPYYDAKVKAEPNTYDVFVKLGKRGQTASTQLYVENYNATTCQSIGTVVANGDEWQEVGSWTSTSEEPVRFQLASDIFTSQANANRASVMLVPKDNPPCKPTINCSFTYENQPAYIQPTGTVLSEDTLHVLQVHGLEGDTLEQVDYYSDGQLLYTTPTLEPFNLRYVPGGDHNLSRVLQYKSGQQVVLQEPIRVSFAKDFQNLLFRLFNSNKIGLQILAALTIVGLAGLMVAAVIRALHRRYIWKLSHGLISEKAVAPAPRFLSEDSTTMKNVKRYTPYVLITLGVLFVLGLTDAYVAQLFRVDGISMETTLQTDDQLLVNKMPKTWASLNRQEYVPKRGDVVVFHKAHSDFFLESNEDEKNVYVVKRVLGLPGERVVIKEGVVTVYNKEHPEGFNPDAGSSWEKTLTIDPYENIDVTLGQSEIFASGDNRPESIDSRANGPIDVRDLVGRAEARIMPFSKRRSL